MSVNFWFMPVNHCIKYLFFKDCNKKQGWLTVHLGKLKVPSTINAFSIENVAFEWQLGQINLDRFSIISQIIPGHPYPLFCRLAIVIWIS